MVVCVLNAPLSRMHYALLVYHVALLALVALERFTSRCCLIGLRLLACVSGMMCYSVYSECCFTMARAFCVDCSATKRYLHVCGMYYEEGRRVEEGTGYRQART